MASYLIRRDNWPLNVDLRLDVIDSAEAATAPGDMSSDIENTTLSTLASLQYRLERLAYYIAGSSPIFESTKLQDACAKGRTATVHARLEAIEAQLSALAQSKPAVRDILQLRT